MSLGCMVFWKEINGRMVYVSNFDAIREENSMCDICTNTLCTTPEDMPDDNKFIMTRCANFKGRG